MSSRVFPRARVRRADIKTSWHQIAGSWDQQTQFTISPDMLLLTQSGLHQREAFYQDRDVFVDALAWFR